MKAQQIHVCPGCSQQVSTDGDGVYQCPGCATQFTVGEEVRYGKVVRKTEFVGWGAALQAIGLVTMFLFLLNPLAIFAGILLLVVGGRLAIKPVCSECGSRVEKTARLCPACKARLE